MQKSGRQTVQLPGKTRQLNVYKSLYIYKNKITYSYPGEGKIFNIGILPQKYVKDQQIDCSITGRNTPAKCICKFTMEDITHC